MRANAAALPPWFRTPATPTAARPPHPLSSRRPPPASCPHQCPRIARSPLLSFFAPCCHGWTESSIQIFLYGLKPRLHLILPRYSVPASFVFGFFRMPVPIRRLYP